MVPDTKSVLMSIEVSATAAQTNFGTIDTKGFDYLQLNIAGGTMTAAETALTQLRCGESDTAPTDVTTDCILIPAFTGAAATSTSAGFVLPAASSTEVNLYRFNINLLGRKRYFACELINTVVMSRGPAMIGTLSRRESGAEMAAAVVTNTGCRLVVSG